MSDDGLSLTVRERLLADRKILLDLGTRNRLIHIPLRTKNIRAIEIVDEKPSEVFRLLSEGKNFTFLQGRAHSPEESAQGDEDPGEIGGIPQPEENESVDARGVAKRHTDTRLQTRLTSIALQKRLFDIWYDARTLEEEQGVNILYLALGLLKWFEDEKSDTERYAPLVLLPVKLERTSAADRFSLNWRTEPPSPNLSLQAKMNAEFGIKIEDFGDEDDVDLVAYFEKVAATVSVKARWQVQPNAMVLGFFSFAKFLMYRDLDPENWPATTALDKHAVISSLLTHGFAGQDPIIGDMDKIDAIIPPLAMNHVVDADSSQSVAIEEVARGRHLVIKGPPGTGKSQTITNIIAAAAAQGRKVLFVAEKMAALNVVHSRLRNAGLSSLVLELHSNKISKRVVLEELKRTKEQTLGPRRGDATVIERLTEVRDALNVHADLMHRSQGPSGLTPFQLLGELVKIKKSDGLPGYVLRDPETWTALEVDRRHSLLQEIADRVASIGPPHEHPWRGVRRDALDPSEIEGLIRLLAVLDTHLANAKHAATHASGLFELDQIDRFSDFAPRLAILEAAASLPECDRRALADPIWINFADVQNLVARGEQFHRLKTIVDSSFEEGVWRSSLDDCRRLIATKGKSPLRIFSGAYRAQMNLLGSYMKVPLPKTQEQRLRLVDGLLAAQAARRSFEDLEVFGASAFGMEWRGDQSDWPRLKTLVSWWAHYRTDPLVGAKLGKLASTVLSPQDMQSLSILLSALPNLQEAWTGFARLLDLDLNQAFGVAKEDAIKLDLLSERLMAWRHSTERVTKWIAFAYRTSTAREQGLQSLMDGLMSGALPAAQLLSTFVRAYYEALRADFFAKQPALRRFDGDHHDRIVDSFRSLDRMRIELAREQIAVRHASSIPKAGGGIGPLGVLNGEFAKKRNHLSIRQLLERAAPLVQQIKPIFLMSPLSVAQFLKPGAVAFDLLVVDEASQIEPVDALGAIARCQQIVVVGDERQLPPTRFFAKLTGDLEERDDEDEVTLQARDAESVLDLCLARGMPHRMLNWHYRSKHQSLIAVSNRQFYENRLYIVPSPYDVVAGMGLKFNHLQGGHYDRGNTRTNPVEAKAVAEAVIQHARNSPGQSLGVATFSVAQRQAILSELELLRRAHPDLEDFFSHGKSEPFFVKNLENIQGDERDIIFISVGYSRTQEGYLSMSFGPLNAEGGERRLNVLISRAKVRCEVFTSITGDDIDLTRARAKGVAALKMFLTFAQTGKLDVATVTDRGAESVFEEQVADALINAGHDVKTQIGSAGFFVDLAISDPQKPGRFVLGIECDGAQYHSSRSARDRDRLRQSVLEDHGWFLHRIWSTDWFLRPDEELRKVQNAIEAAKIAWQERDNEIARPKPAVPLHLEADASENVVATTAPLVPEEPLLSRPYVESSLSVRGDAEPHAVPPAEMAKYVVEVVSVEGPVHESEIVVRVRSAWGLARTGNRIRDAVLTGIEVAKRNGVITGGPFYTRPGDPLVVRNRANVGSANLRKPEILPPDEIELAILSIIDANFGAEREQLIVSTARLFGFSSTSTQLKSAIEASLSALVAKALVKIDANRVSR